MFALVNPPFVSLWRPNLGLSLLKARLMQEKLPAKIFYADHRMAARLGLKRHTWIQADYDAMMGEWLFSGFVREDAQWDGTYLDFLHRQGYDREQTATLRSWLELLPDYLNDTVLEILAHRPVVVGCSSTFQQNNAGLAILRALKRRAPEVVTVMGGANLEGELGGPVTALPWVDYVVSGEAEECICDFYRLCQRYGVVIPRDELPAEVACYGRPASRRGKVVSLDALPYPDFEDLFAGLAAHPELVEVDPALVLEGSRGCWWGQVSHCSFCGLNGSGMSYRAKTPARLLEEIFALSAQWNRQDVEMVDNIIAPAHLKEVLPELAARQSGLRFFWEVKANLKASHFELLRRAGVLWLQPGIESFSDRVLQLMRKGQRAIQNLLVLKAARENGIRLSWNLLMGHPGETLEDVREQKDLVSSITHLQPPSAVCEVRPDRFSPLFAENFVEPYEVYRYIYDVPEEELRTMAYFFTFGPLPAAHARALAALQRKVAHWRSCWQRPERRSLHVQEPNVVADTRQPGPAVLHELSAGAFRLLADCAQPARLSDLARDHDLGHLDELAERRLCYRDGTHALSLVLSQASALLPVMP